MPLAVRSQEVASRENAACLLGTSVWGQPLAGAEGPGTGRGGCSGWDAGRCVEFWEGLDVGGRPGVSSLGRKAGQGPLPSLVHLGGAWLRPAPPDQTKGLLRGPQGVGAEHGPGPARCPSP